MSVVYPPLSTTHTAHSTGEGHRWRLSWALTRECQTCGIIVNRRTGEVLREGVKDGS